MCGRMCVSEKALVGAADYVHRERQQLPEGVKTDENCGPGTTHTVISKGRRIQAAIWGLITPWG